MSISGYICLGPWRERDVHVALVEGSVFLLPVDYAHACVYISLPKKDFSTSPNPGNALVSLSLGRRFRARIQRAVGFLSALVCYVPGLSPSSRANGCACRWPLTCLFSLFRKTSGDTLNKPNKMYRYQNTRARLSLFVPTSASSISLCIYLGKRRNVCSWPCLCFVVVVVVALFLLFRSDLFCRLSVKHLSTCTLVSCGGGSLLLPPPPPQELES